MLTIVPSPPLHAIPHDTPPETMLSDDSSNMPQMQTSDLAPGSYQRPEMDHFVRIFKDPPNVEGLLACVQPPPVSLLDYMHIKMSAPVFRPEDRLHLSALRMGDDSSQERAFVAALYLKDRLSMDEKEIEVWCKNGHINRLGNIAREIMYAEPMLQGFSLAILLEHHQCIIKHYRDLEEGLRAGAYPDWVPTHFSNIARDLSILEENNGLIQLRMKNMEAYRLAKESRNAKVLQRMEYRMKAEQRFAKFNGAMSPATHTWTKDEEDRNSFSTPPAQAETVADASIKAEDQHSNSSPTLQLHNVSPVHSSCPASGSHQRPDMEFFVNIFKDPPNVDELLASIRPPPTSVKVYKQTHLSRPIEIEDGQLILSDFQIENDAPREKAFLAALYLKNRLSLGEKQQRAWCIGRTSRLHQITNEILNTEPRLHGFASYALLEHHICVIKLYQDLEEGLQAGAYPDWVPTHFSNIARELSILENNSGLLRLRLKYRDDQIQSREKWKEKRLKRMIYQTEQMDQPRQLAKARIDEVMITIAIAMARNDHGVPIMVPAFDENRCELFMTELEYENEDADDEEEGEGEGQVPIATRAAPIETADAGKVFKAEDASWMDWSYTPSSPHEPSQAPAPGAMNWSRSRSTPQVFNTPQTQSPYYASGPSRRRGLEYFANIFKDPPNVDELLESIRPPLTSAQVLTSIERSMSHGEGDMINLLSLQAENNPTREKAFLTTLYLKNRLSFGEEEELSIGYNPLYNHLKGIMREIRTTEPKLRGVSVHDLMTYHQSVITLYRAFEEELQARCYNWAPTHFSNLLRGLRITEDKWRVHNEEWKKVEEERERRTEQTEQTQQTSYTGQTSGRSPSLGAAWHERWMRDNGGSKGDGGWDKNDGISDSRTFTAQRSIHAQQTIQHRRPFRDP
ncbi:MAG: hypothetical protein J3Q66DRAFT_91387 [Benniella sp.]|nr:MAG: hypothetical protein J3Q66DRAFT_91387 [Benniella sp.]